MGGEGRACRCSQLGGGRVDGVVGLAGGYVAHEVGDPLSSVLKGWAAGRYHQGL
jgi:hypothetical protein